MTLTVSAVGALGLVLLYAGITGTSPRTALRPFRRFDSIAEGAGIRGLTGGRLLFALMGSWIGAFVVATGITSSLAVGSAAASLAVWMGLASLRTRRDRRIKSFGDAWPDAIETLIAGVRAGVSLPEACIGLTERGPRELGAGFESFASTYRATGSFEASIDRMRADLADPVADRVCVALTMAHEVGGTDLVRVLRALGDFVRDDLRVRKEVQARWSWTITAARVAAAAPWAVLLLMTSRPEAAAAYDSPTGAMVIAAGGGATLLGYRLMLRAARLPEDPRLPR